MDFGSILRKSATMYRDNPAVVFEGRALTYAQLYERSCRLASALKGLGLRKGDRVATLGDNGFESMEELTAVALGGFVRSPMYTQNPVEMHLYMLGLTGAKALIVQDRYHKELAPRLGEVPGLEYVIVHGGANGAIDYDGLLARAKPRDPGARVRETDVHMIRFSAGTTGRPKGIVHTNRNWLAMGNELALVMPRLEETDVQLLAGPLTHATALLVWPMIAAGGKQVVMPAFDPARALELIEQERCSVTILVPTMIHVMANHPDAAKRDVSSLRAVFYGAAPIAERTLEQAQQLWGNIMYQIYGQSESLPVSVLTPRHHVIEGTESERKWLRSAGRPTPNSFVKIIDDDGKELPVGEVGEIAVRTPGAMKEIWNDAGATSERLTKDGFVRTRDVGYVDDDGFVYIADRKEDMIISGGFNIWPAEVENALFSHPAVLEAAVIGIPDEKWGEAVKAVVVLREDQTATEEELIEWCREKIGATKKPKSVDFSTEPLPKSAVGKMLRRLVKEKYWAGRERRVGGA